MYLLALSRRKTYIANESIFLSPEDASISSLNKQKSSSGLSDPVRSEGFREDRPLPQ